MTNYKKISFAVVLAVTVFGFTGCGGGGGGGGGGSTVPVDQTQTGTFIDAPVKGLLYQCSSGGTGTTNIDGNYTCNQGDTVKFYANNVLLGSVYASQTITPLDLFPMTADKEKMNNVVQLLHSLDADGNPDNGIDINTSLNINDLNVSFDSNTFQNSLVSKFASNGATVYHREKSLAKMFSYLQNNNINVPSSISSITYELNLLRNQMCGDYEVLSNGECLTDSQYNITTVSNTTEFRAALVSAASNGLRDVILLNDGTYNIKDDNLGTFEYISSESQYLDIIGKSGDASKVILDGNNSSAVLTLLGEYRATCRLPKTTHNLS